MQIEAGKYYKTWDGRKVGPMIASTSGDNGGLYAEEFGLYRPDGRFGYADECFCDDLDIIAEWRDADQLTAIEHLRKAAELFLQSGNDEAAYDVIGLVIDNEGLK